MYLLGGLAVTFAAEPLVENRAFQFAVAAAAGVSFFLLLALLVLLLFVSHVFKVSLFLLVSRAAATRAPWGRVKKKKE